MELPASTLTAGPTLRPGGSQQVRVTADYQNVSNLDITAETGVTYQLSNTNVLSISAGGLLTSVGTNSATATVTAAYQGKNSRLFVDGVENGSNNSMTYKLTDLTPLSNVGLGHSQYIQDADFAGAIAEFRIYRGTFLDAEVAADFAAGPDDLPGETASRRLAVSFDAGKIAVSWPATTTGFALERSATLGTGVNWTPVTVDSANRVTVDATGAGAFYRLRKLP